MSEIPDALNHLQIMQFLCQEMKHGATCLKKTNQCKFPYCV